MKKVLIKLMKDMIILFIRPTSQVFNCQNKHYEKICHFEKLAAASKIAAIKSNRFNAAIVPFVFCHKFCTEYYN